jgi:hypothetical protein
MSAESQAQSVMPLQAVTHDRIGVDSPSETVAVYQIAARWAERYAGQEDDLPTMLERFRTAYNYLDAVIHGLEPPGAESGRP